MIKILLVCGGGASTGFLASNMRKSAKKDGIACEVVARPVSSLDEHLPQADVVLVAPHFKFKVEEIQSKAMSLGKQAVVADEDAYGTMDGGALIQQAIKLMEGTHE